MPDKTEVALGVSHENGQVVIKCEVEGENVRIELDPVNALTHAQQVIRHSDLAREQQMLEV